MSTTLHEKVSALLLDPADATLARSFFGTADPAAIAQQVEDFCRARLGRRAAACDDFEQSVSAVIVLRLDDASRVVLKWHALAEGRWGTAGPLPELLAVYELQDALAQEGLPCARVLRPPERWDQGAVAVMTFLDGRAAEDPRQPQVRSAMARMFVELVRAAAPLRALPRLPVQRLPESLWPRPHNALFDLEAPGGEWIDDRARAARSVLDLEAPPPLLAHTDFSAANARVRGGRVCAIYDMDSMALTDEMLALANVAVHHTYGGDARAACTTRAQARAFVTDYERARGAPLTPADRRRLDAAAIYTLGYTARCEHSGDPAGRRLGGSTRDLLRAAPEDGYLG